MPLVPISLGLKSNPARYKQGGSAVIINGFAEQVGEEGKTPWHIYATDGLQGFADLDAITPAGGGVRAALNLDGVLYSVAGTRVYKTTSNGVVTLLGSMNISTTAPVFMERNRRSTPDIAIVCDGLMYYVRADVLAQVTDVDLLAPTSLSFVDGYFVIGTANNKWQIGAIDDASAWDPLDFARADANPDAVVTVSAMQSQAVIFGELSTEFHRNTGNADFAFEFVTSADVGCLAAGSVQRLEQSIAFVASDRTVRMFVGYEARRVSSHAVERDIESLTDRSIIKSSTWVKDGHTFYSITAPGFWTWAYDTVTALWHRRKSYGRPDWRVTTVTAFAGKLIAGDADSGKLYEMSAAFTDEAGDPLVTEVITPPVHAFPNEIRHDALFIDLERGVGTGQGDPEDVDPEVMVDWSEDGGATFGNERCLKLGQQGKAVIRVDTWRLGVAPVDGRVYRLRISAKVRRGFYAASLMTTPLRRAS